MLDAMVVAVAHEELEVRDAQTFLAPKRTDELAATIEAEPVRKFGNTVRGRTRTSEPYAIWQETKDWYHHRTGQARYMRDGLLSRAYTLGPAVAAAIKAAIG